MTVTKTDAIIRHMSIEDLDAIWALGHTAALTLGRPRLPGSSAHCLPTIEGHKKTGTG